MDDLIEVVVGKQFSVFMTRAVAKRFDKIDAERRARCLKWMKCYADDGHEYLDDSKLKYEGRFSTGSKSGTKAGIWAFKVRQVRVYGGLAGERFICTEIDDSKKQDAADQSLLHAAARKLSEYL